MFSIQSLLLLIVVLSILENAIYLIFPIAVAYFTVAIDFKKLWESDYNKKQVDYGGI
jgi:hypothetical protein